jgi:hypothetical protein
MTRSFLQNVMRARRTDELSDDPMTRSLLQELQDASDRGAIVQTLPVQSEQPITKRAMKAYEFPAHITVDGKLELPDAALPRSLNNQTVRVIILINETENSSEQTAWTDLTATQFLAGYSSVDAIYDDP